MRNIIKVSLLLTLGLFVLTACQTQELTKPEIDRATEKLTDEYTLVDMRRLNSGGDSFEPLWAGRNVQAGYVQIANDIENLYVTYYVNDEWELVSSNLHVAQRVENIPMDSAGMPLPDRFTHQVNMARGTTFYTHIIPLAENGLRIRDEIFLVSRVSLTRNSPKGEGLNEVYGWVGDKGGNEPQWWQFARYILRLNDIGSQNAGRVKMDRTSNQELLQ